MLLHATKLIMDELIKWDVHLASSMWHTLMHYVLLLLFQGLRKSSLIVESVTGTGALNTITTHILLAYL